MKSNQDSEYISNDEDIKEIKRYQENKAVSGV